MKKDLRLYILMRNDLESMSTGRAAAQASHAANAFIYKFGKRKNVQEWQKQTSQGFGTAIVLSVSFDQLNELKKVCLQAILSKEVHTDRVVDPDYAISISSELIPFINQEDISSGRIKIEPSITNANKYILHREEITCAYIFGDKELLKSLVENLSLYP